MITILGYITVPVLLKVIDKIVGASLPEYVTNEKQAREFLLSISDKQLEVVVKNTISYLKECNIKIPINEVSK